jgi:hypothetical protein
MQQMVIPADVEYRDDGDYNPLHKAVVDFNLQKAISKGLKTLSAPAGRDKKGERLRNLAHERGKVAAIIKKKNPKDAARYIEYGKSTKESAREKGYFKDADIDFKLPRALRGKADDPYEYLGSHPRVEARMMAHRKGKLAGEIGGTKVGRSTGWSHKRTGYKSAVQAGQKAKRAAKRMGYYKDEDIFVVPVLGANGKIDFCPIKKMR